MKLTIELVPKTSFYKNLRSELKLSDWERIRKETLHRANYVCEICGGKSRNRNLDCHEIWSFNESTHTQKLEKVVALCENCHEVKHIGLAQIKGNFNRAVRHFMVVNKIDRRTAEMLIEEATDIWDKRSQHNWKLDISKITEGEIK